MFSSTSTASVSAHRKQAGREKARLRTLRQEEELLRRREKDGFPATTNPQTPRRPRDPIEEDVEANIREYMARTGPRGERLTRAQKERLLKQELKGLGHQLEKLEKKAKADEATQDLPELDDHTLEELYQALMLPPPPTAEEARLARLEGGRREKSLEWDGRGRKRLERLSEVAALPPTKAEERRMRASMDLKQRLIDAREKGKMLLPPSASSVRRVEQVPVEQAMEAEEAAVEEEMDMAALPYAERQEIRLQQLFARLALVHNSSEPTASATASESDAESLHDIKSNLAHRIAKILQEHHYELQSTDQSATEATTNEAAEPLPPFPEVRLDARAPALETVHADPDASTNVVAAAEPRGDLVTRAESMINDLSSPESRTFMLDSIEKLVRSASPPSTTTTSDSPTSTTTLPLGVATIEEWTALAVASAKANDTATLSRTMSLMRAAGYHPAPLSLYNDVMDVFATQGQVSLCQEWIAQMSQLGLEPDDHTYHSLTKAYVNTAQFLPAIELLNSLETAARPASMATYTLIIDRLLDPLPSPSREERPELQALAWNLFYHMRLHAHPIPDAPLYALMIRACARGVPQPHDIDDPTQRSRVKISDAERALDLFREMTTRYAVRPNAEVYNALILACSRRKDFYLEAFRLLREMVELEQGHLGAEGEAGLRFAPDRWTFNALLQGSTAPPTPTSPPAQQPSDLTSTPSEEDRTTPEEAAQIFSALVPQTPSDLVSESRSLFARIIADQPTSNVEGPLGAVHPGIRLVNAYLTVLAAHLPVHQRAAVLQSTLSPVEGEQEGQQEGSLEHALFAKLGLKANEHSFRIILESLSDADASHHQVVQAVWERFTRFMSYPNSAERAETSTLIPTNKASKNQAVDAVQVTKCCNDSTETLRRALPTTPPHHLY
ncbi:hypothetical protein [Sporisorium scitamineum]|uniref:Uncharacterized protein n=1 Tax=Sporisorium scitamineum TaxID=49012 RepID=A0A0F7RUZ7_9BASI|nr:hypothetical protein [Sporisorium scitamineum]